MSEKITIEVEIDKQKLSDFIKRKMIEAGYPEKDLKGIKEFLDESDIARYLLQDLVDEDDVTIC